MSYSTVHPLVAQQITLPTLPINNRFSNSALRILSYHDNTELRKRLIESLSYSPEPISYQLPPLVLYDPARLEEAIGRIRPILPVQNEIRIKESCSLSLKIIALAILSTIFVIGVLGFAGVIPMNTIAASALTFTPPVILFSALLHQRCSSDLTSYKGSGQ